MLQKNPYCQLMRLDKPIGVWLLLIPCLWGIWIAPTIMNHTVPLGTLLYYSGLFLIASGVMRSAGCVINDYFDRELDKSVDRTKNRPLANGTIKPIYALILFSILSLIGLCLLTQLPLITLIIGICVFIPIIVYPLMKRLTYFPQLFLGLVYNIGIVMGFVTISGQFNSRILWLYAGGVLITLGYDTIYAFQDIQDDLKIGVKSSAIAWQKNPKFFIGLCYGIAFICFAIFFTHFWINCSLLIFLITIFIKLSYWQCDNIPQTLNLFKHNVWLLLGLWVLILLFTYL